MTLPNGHYALSGPGRQRRDAMAEIEWDESRGLIVVMGLRYESSLEILALTLNKLVQQRRLTGLRDMRNESTDDRTRLVIQLRRGANAQPVLDAIDAHMPSDDAEVDVDPEDWDEPDVTCPRCGAIVRRSDFPTRGPVAHSLIQCD